MYIVLTTNVYNWQPKNDYNYSNNYYNHKIIEITLK